MLPAARAAGRTRRRRGDSLDDAIDSVRASTLFTTHTPVPAGIDRFDRKLVRPGDEAVGGTPRRHRRRDLCMGHHARRRSRRSRSTPQRSPCTCATGSTASASSTPGSAARCSPRCPGPRASRASPTASTPAPGSAPRSPRYYDDVLGAGWSEGDEAAWANVDALDTGELGRIRRDAGLALVDRVAASTGVELDPDGCIIGFARRFATYKRAALLLRDPEGLEEALAGGAQFVFAGKAHPADADGKAVLAEIAVVRPVVGGRWARRRDPRLRHRRGP